MRRVPGWMNRSVIFLSAEPGPIQRVLRLTPLRSEMRR